MMLSSCWIWLCVNRQEAGSISTIQETRYTKAGYWLNTIKILVRIVVDIANFVQPVLRAKISPCRPALPRGMARDRSTGAKPGEIISFEPSGGGRSPRPHRCRSRPLPMWRAQVRESRPPAASSGSRSRSPPNHPAGKLHLRRREICRNSCHQSGKSSNRS